MNIIICSSQNEASTRYASLLTDSIIRHPSQTIGLATGKTMRPIYKEFIKKIKSKNIDVQRLTFFQLDEYLQLPQTSSNSFFSELRTTVFDPLKIQQKNIHTLDPYKKSPASYEKEIKKTGGIAIQLLGIGRDGHIGFNEPGSSFSSRTRVVTLKEKTRTDAVPRFKKKQAVPKKAITQGIGTILKAKRIVLAAFGESKALAIASAFARSPSTKVPASALQHHPDVTVILDRKAASLLPLDMNRKGITISKKDKTI